MNLKCIPHPSPYQVSWLQKGQQVTVTKKCLLSFYLNKFTGQGLCDLVEMDECHVLLGRLWLFDRNILHDGMENMYKFNKDGEHYRLGPMVEYL
jgi:hypothetical protein